ncbi:hypothetical protein GLOIN_2v1772162 [Rhizophagus clarus]|uniref:Uncharacterized protein n=1 Tax=Rhizophagus clarus TaxID=94130 RepID=A0A8H3KU82_9GLOM|nr:hypothetical protein GLOIN_2v1772162 [Rhizophagus clarus]
MDGKSFKKFHTNWKLLYRVLQENRKNVSLHNIYGFSDENWKEIKIKKIEIQLQWKEIAYCHNEIEFLPDGNIYDTNHNTFENFIPFVEVYHSGGGMIMYLPQQTNIVWYLFQAIVLFSLGFFDSENWKHFMVTVWATCCECPSLFSEIP